MIHRTLVLAGALLLALALAAPALAARVHVRVEGATTTIFGATEPRVTPVRGTFAPPAGPSVTVSADTPLGALEAASRRGEFYYRLEAFSFGPYVAQIGRHAGTGTTGWVFKVNGKSPPVAADKHVLRAGDTVLWYFARFGPAGGPKTLRLDRLSGGCFAAKAVDDNGKAARTTVTFVVDGRLVARAAARLCPSGGWRTLRAVKAGHVRSRVVLAPRNAAGGSGGAALAGRAR